MWSAISSQEIGAQCGVRNQNRFKLSSLKLFLFNKFETRIDQVGLIMVFFSPTPQTGFTRNTAQPIANALHYPTPSPWSRMF